MDYLQITAIGDQIGFQRANCSKNKDPNKGGSDVSVEGKEEEKKTEMMNYSHLSKTLMRLWS